MSKLIITGPKNLNGELDIYGAKNSVLAIMAASIINGGKNTIRNCPNLSDVRSTFDILKNLGCKVSYDARKRVAIIDSTNIDDFCIHEKLMREMRSSVVFLGSIVARCRKAIISYPGGCELGPRPIDLHLKAFKQLGVIINESHGYIKCELDKIKPQTIHLSFPSVGATENVMLLASVSDVEVTIDNAAREPEIIDLQNYLNKMGASIKGAGTEVISIKGVKDFKDVDHKIIPDRIVTSTYLCAVANCGGEVTLNNVEFSHIQSIVSLLSECGCEIGCVSDKITIKCKKRLNSAATIKTMPYPGFPTDVQAIAMAAFSKAKGTTVFVENMFENRFKQVEELIRMGADITVDGRVAVVRGTDKHFGASVKAADLRGGAALVVAGLGAYGITEISNIQHIDRGYEKIEDEFSKLGAEISRIGSSPAIVKN